MRRWWVVPLTLWLAPLGTPEAAPPAQGTELLYIDNALGEDLTVVRLPDHRVLGSVTVGSHPHGLAASGDGKRLYVSVESTNEVLALDIATDKILWRLTVSNQPNQIALSGDGRHLYVPIRPADYVEVIDTQERRVVAKVKVGHSLHNAVACADGHHIYATSMDDHQVTIIDADTQRSIGTIPCGGIVRPIDVTRDETRMYVALSDLHGCVVADIPARRVVGKLFLPPPPEGVEPLVPHTPTHGLGLTPNGRMLVVTSVVGDYVGLFAVPGHEFLGRVATGKAPNWVAFRRDGKVCYVSNAGSDDVSAVDLEARKEVARIKAGKQPKRLLTVVVPERLRQAPNNHSR
jgi:YVTN family beta-propeller protein